MKILIIALAFFSLPSFANQGTCTPYSIPIDKIGPLRNQGLNGLCYAYEAADLVSFKLGVSVSALSIALAYFYAEQYPNLSDLYAEGGEAQSAIESTLDIGGFCLESQLPSNEDHIDSSPKPHGRIHDALISFDSFNTPSPEQLKTAQSVFPGVDFDTYRKSFRGKTKQERVLFLENAVCKKRIPLASFRFKHFLAKKDLDHSAVLKTINTQIRLGNLIGLGFHSNIIYSQQEPDDDHAATIIGRRWNSKKSVCEYQLRDSFGPQCTLYKPNIDCNAGTIWVEEQLLLSSITELEYFE